MRPLSFLFLIVLLSCQPAEKNRPLLAATKAAPQAADSLAPYQPQPETAVVHPEWLKNATIYEVNLRQYTPEGTFRAFTEHLPRLKAMGVDVIWLMPVQPIGQQNRKGSLGSYYAVADYYGVNPEFGDLEDFRALVTQIHDHGMHVIIDWVANHTARDNVLVQQHPEWFVKTADGRFATTPWRDYEDIIELDYAQAGLRRFMTEAMKWWVRETGIDGFRCDMASFVPTDFWENLRRELDALRPVFLLAESESADLHRRAFDATYTWKLWDHLHAFAQGKENLERLTGLYFAEHVSAFPRDGLRMTFIDNHDKNSWEGTMFSNFGAALPAMITLCATMDGIPLVYSGQEAGLDRSLRFFDKDTIVWKPHPFERLYTALFDLKHRNPALWNGARGGPMIRVPHDQPRQVLAFSREAEGQKVVSVFNLSPAPVNVRFSAPAETGNYRELFSGNLVTWVGQDTLQLGAWDYRILVRQ